MTTLLDELEALAAEMVAPLIECGDYDRGYGDACEVYAEDIRAIIAKHREQMEICDSCLGDDVECDACNGTGKGE